jgi:hypothetical protein
MSLPDPFQPAPLDDGSAVSSGKCTLCSAAADLGIAWSGASKGEPKDLHGVYKLIKHNCACGRKHSESRSYLMKVAMGQVKSHQSKSDKLKAVKAFNDFASPSVGSGELRAIGADGYNDLAEHMVVCDGCMTLFGDCSDELHALAKTLKDSRLETDEPDPESKYAEPEEDPFERFHAVAKQFTGKKATQPTNPKPDVSSKLNAVSAQVKAKGIPPKSDAMVDADPSKPIVAKRPITEVDEIESSKAKVPRTLKVKLENSIASLGQAEQQRAELEQQRAELEQRLALATASVSHLKSKVERRKAKLERNDVVLPKPSPPPKDTIPNDQFQKLLALVNATEANYKSVMKSAADISVDNARLRHVVTEQAEAMAALRAEVAASRSRTKVEADDSGDESADADAAEVEAAEVALAIARVAELTETESKSTDPTESKVAQQDPSPAQQASSSSDPDPDFAAEPAAPSTPIRRSSRSAAKGLNYKEPEPLSAAELEGPSA